MVSAGIYCSYHIIHTMSKCRELYLASLYFKYTGQGVKCYLKVIPEKEYNH